MKLSQKLASIIVFLLFAAFLITLLFYPSLSIALSLAIIIFTIGTAIFFTTNNNWKDKKRGELTNSEFARNTAFDLIGLALTMGAAIWLGRLAGNYVWQIWGMIAGIFAAMAVGLVVAFIVGRIWGLLSQPLRVSS